MKFLLTSGGITNKSIAKALVDLVGKKANETKIAFIPTAANVEHGKKDWLINDLYNLQKEGYKVDIVDFSAIPKEIWEKRLEETDVLFFGGGNTFWLRYCLKKSGLWDLLPELLNTRVYAGISAGSIITTKSLELSESKKIYDEDNSLVDDKGEDGLGFMNFYIRPHLNSSDFPNIRREILEKRAKDIPGIIYAIDDQSALKIVDGKIEIISEGEYLIFNNA